MLSSVIWCLRLNEEDKEEASLFSSAINIISISITTRMMSEEEEGGERRMLGEEEQRLFNDPLPVVSDSVLGKVRPRILDEGTLFDDRCHPLSNGH